MVGLHHDVQNISGNENVSQQHSAGSGIFIIKLWTLKHDYILVPMRPCKIQCTFDCNSVDKIISPLFVYARP